MPDDHIQGPCPNCGGTEFTSLGERALHPEGGGQTIVVDSKGFHHNQPGSSVVMEYLCNTCMEIRFFAVPRQGKG